MKRVAIIALAGLAVVFIGIPLFRYIQSLDAEEAPTTPTPVVFGMPERERIEEVRSYPGRLSADAHIRLFPRAGGTVTEVHIQENDVVTADTEIMSLDDDAQRLQAEQAYAAWQAAEAAVAKATSGARPEELENARATLAQSERDLTLARDNLERRRSLFENGGISRAAFEQAQNQVAAAETQVENARRTLRLLETGARTEDLDAARAQAEAAEKRYDLARLQLDYARIRTPIAGRVVEVLAERGDTVSPQNPVAVVMNDGLMKATLTLPERDYGRLVNRDAPISARVRPLAYEGEIVVTGEVTAVSRTIDPASRTFSAEVAVDNPDDLLRPGMYVDIDLILSQRNDAVVVPSSAVVQRNGHSVVFTAEARGDGAPIARPVPVKLGLRHGAVVEIREGLDGTEEIIIEGNAFLEAGQAVRPIAQDGSS